MQASTSVLSSRYKWLGPQNALLTSFPFNAHLILYAFTLEAHHTWCFFALPFMVAWFFRMNGATTAHGGGGHDFDHFAQQYRFWDHSQIWKEFPQPTHAWMNLFHRGVDLTTDCISAYLFHIMMKGTQDAKISEFLTICCAGLETVMMSRFLVINSTAKGLHLETCAIIRELFSATWRIMQQFHVQICARLKDCSWLLEGSP